MAKQKTVDLKIEAILRLNPDDLSYLDDESLDKWQGMVTELTYQSFKIKFSQIRGHVEFSTPHPTTLKKARIEYLDK
ncbi:MAG: hypothetical protein AAF086_01500 [Planctomycetota bacterium]